MVYYIAIKTRLVISYCMLITDSLNSSVYQSSVLHSQPKSTVGTPAYIAPEVLSRKQYDGKVNLNLVLFAVWSGLVVACPSNFFIAYCYLLDYLLPDLWCHCSSRINLVTSCMCEVQLVLYLSITFQNQLVLRRCKLADWYKLGFSIKV